jgi:hypothetical protein
MKSKKSRGSAKKNKKKAKAPEEYTLTNFAKNIGTTAPMVGGKV